MSELTPSIQPDDEFEEYKIINVEESESGYTLGTDDGWAIPLQKSYGIKPKEGQTVKVWGERGRAIRGIAVDREIAYYRTPEEQDEYNKNRVKEINAEKKAEFEENKDELDRKYEELPEIFRKRIDRFRNNNPDFRWKYEAYELFCCREALKIAEAMEDTDGVHDFSEAKYEEKSEMVDLGEGHSGNTMGTSTMLAYVYLDNPEKVIEVHGALAPLVGSKEYGGVDEDSNEKE